MKRMPWHRKQDVKRNETPWGKTKHLEIHGYPKGKPFIE